MPASLRVTITAAIVFIPIGLAPALFAQTPESLHEVLQSDASLREKQVACKQLALVGTADSVPILAELLKDRKLTHVARFALENIPDPAVDSAFRNALETLQGPPLVGVINSIGVRRDQDAVDALIGKLDGDPNVASAVEAALAKIANESAVKILLKRISSKTADAESTAGACLACGDALLAEQKPDKAIAFYDAVRQSDVPKSLRLAATWSAVRARGTGGLELIATLLNDNDDDIFAIGLQATRGPLASSSVPKLVAALPSNTPARRSRLIATLADLGDVSAVDAVRSLLNDESELVQKSAIAALRELGDESDVSRLLNLAADNDAVSDDVTSTLTVLPGRDVNSAIAARLSADPTNDLLLEVVGRRRIDSAVPDLWKAAKSPEPSVRHIAFRALGETLGDDSIDRLVALALAADAEEDRDEVVRALTQTCMRSPNRDEVIQQVADRYSQAAPESTLTLFELLRVVGGEKALQIVVKGAHDPRDVVQDASTQALGKWLTADVAPELLKLARSFENRKYRVRSMRAYIRVIQQFGLPPDERLEMARQAFQAAERDDERVLVIHALLRFPNPDSLKLTTDHLSNPVLRDTAAQISLHMADRISDKAALRTAMEKVINSGANPKLIKQAHDVLARING